MREVLEGILELQRAYFDWVGQAIGNDCAHPKQGRILCLLLAMEGVSQADLTRRMGVSAATVAVSIGRLEKLGYVRRSRNVRNQRAYVLTLTGEGRAQAQKLQLAMAAACESAVAGIPADSLTQFSALVLAMTENLRKPVNTSSV